MGYPLLGVCKSESCEGKYEFNSGVFNLYEEKGVNIKPRVAHPMEAVSWKDNELITELEACKRSQNKKASIIEKLNESLNCINETIGLLGSLN